MDQDQFAAMMDQGQFYSTLGVVWVFGFVAVFIVIWHLRNKRRLEKLRMIHEERMKAMEKGIPLPEFPEFADEESGRKIGRVLAGHIEGKPWNPKWPLGLGALLIMGGIGTSVAMKLSAWDFHNELWAFGLIGVFLGVGFFLYYGLTRTPGGDT
jgi:hypothetical protein